METYVINGVEVEYDTFDIVNIEVYYNEVERIKQVSEELSVMPDTKTIIQNLREFCEEILDTFDCILGEGSARKIFGTKMNIVDIKNGYEEFTSAVNSAMANCFGPVSGNQNTANMNREQRRKAEREARRNAAAVAAKKKAEMVDKQE